MVRRLGLHTSIAGSLEHAALEAVRVGANTFQIFSASPRQWRARMPDPLDIKRFRVLREKHDLRPLVIHDNYLINLASCDEGLRRQSVEAFRGEIERALAMGAEYLVAHPGNCKGHSMEEGIVALVRSLVEAAHGLDTKGLTVLLENMAGAGAVMGSRFEELADVRRYAGEFTDLAIGYCIDTCHTLAAGFDIASAAGLKKTVAEIERVLGWEKIPVIHANDSKMPLGSRLDRHQNIGEGCIGEDGFRRILQHPKLRGKAFILETPHEEPGDDVRNLEALEAVPMKTELLRFNGGVERDPAIEAWFEERAGELGAMAREWFEVMRDCGDEVRELVHDGCPVACLGDVPFGYVNVFTAHVNVGFFQGASLPDPARLLEGNGKFMRHVKLRPGKAVDAKALRRLIEAAYGDMKARVEHG